MEEEFLPNIEGILENGNAFRGEDWRDRKENDNDDREENDNDDNAVRDEEIVIEPSKIYSYTYQKYDLELIKNILYVGLHQLFDEFEIKTDICPDLTRPPYNLAAVGLSGNTKILQLGTAFDFMPVLNRSPYNIGRLLLNYCYDSFVIGTGYAATPSMPYNGHLTINAIISPSRNITNNSCIVYEEAGQRKLVIVNDPNKIKCSIIGNLFVSEGQEGKVIEVRAKGRRTAFDIITLIQNCLFKYTLQPIALGGVLMINGGRIVQHIIPENFPRFATLQELYRWSRSYELKCRNLIMLGALIGYPTSCLRDEQHNILVSNSRYKFNSFSDYQAAGQFINDVTPNETEYIGYFNLPKKMHMYAHSLGINV